MNMKLLFLHEVFPAGGAERATLDIANYVTPYNYEVYVITRQNKNPTCPNITMIEFPDKRDTNTLQNADYLIEVITSLRIDVFVLPIQILAHLNYIMENVSCKLIFSLHSVPLWEVKMLMAEKKKRTKGRFFKKLEWYLWKYPKIALSKRYEKHYIRNHQLVYGLADAYTVLCEDYKQILIRLLNLPPDDNKIHVISNSEPPVENVNLNKKNQIIFVGRLSYEDKRVDRLLHIWKMVYKKAPGWELLIVGDGEEKEDLQKQAKELKLQRIRFVGHTDNVQICYKDASMICLTSTFEGWPLCLTEAQANGVVPVAFECTAGVREILSLSGVNGILVPPFRKRQFARELLDLINSPDRLKQMQQHVIVKSKTYCPELAGEKWAKLFDLLCRKNSIR
jgi:glycosyltransferase involved in cell wall biosynthesis